MTHETGTITDLELQATLAERAEDSRVIQAIMAEPWAITPKAMQRILTIALRQDLDPQAIDARRPPPETSAMRYGYVRDGGVGVLEIRGPVFRYANLFTELSGATSLEMASRDLRALLDDESVERMVIDFDTPGGQVNGTEELAEMIYAARAEKEIVAYASGEAASAGYWLASAADRIVSNKTSLIGSIGAVIGIYADRDQDLVEFVSAQSPKKRLDPTSDAGKAEYQRLVDSIGQVFVETVARNRGIDEQVVLKDYGQGGVMVGGEALSAGLVDDVMSFDSLISELTGSGGNQSEVFMSGNTAKPSGDAGKPQEMTADTIASEHPEIAEHFREQGVKSVDHDALRQEGAEKERERIQSVQEQSYPGHEELIQGLMFDGKTTGEQAAIQVLAAEKARRGDALGKFQKGPEPQPAAEAAPATRHRDDNPHDVSEEACKARWEKSAELRDEFGDDFESYVAYAQANASGKIRVLGGER